MINFDPTQPFVHFDRLRTRIDIALYPLFVGNLQAPLQQTTTHAFALVLGHRNEDAHEEERPVFQVHRALGVHGAEEVLAQRRVGALAPFLGPRRLLRRHDVEVEVPPGPGDDGVGAGVCGFDVVGAGVGAEILGLVLCAVPHGLFAGKAERHGEVFFEAHALDVGQAGEVDFGGYGSDGVGPRRVSRR